MEGMQQREGGVKCKKKGNLCGKEAHPVQRIPRTPTSRPSKLIPRNTPLSGCRRWFIWWRPDDNHAEFHCWYQWYDNSIVTLLCSFSPTLIWHDVVYCHIRHGDNADEIDGFRDCITGDETTPSDFMDEEYYMFRGEGIVSYKLWVRGSLS